MPLTALEKAVFGLLLQEHSLEQIATILQMEVAAVERTRKSIDRKIGSDHMVAYIKYALKMGML